MLGLYGTNNTCSNPNPDDWFGARSQMQVMMFYRPTVEILNCDPAICNGNTLSALRARKAFCKLTTSWGKKIALAAPVITPPDACNGEVNESNTITAITNIQCGCNGSGGTVTSADMDEPWFRASKSSPNCGYTIDQAANEVKDFVDTVRAQFPLLQIGLTEPWRPVFTPTEIQTWVNKLISVGGASWKPAFFHLDVDPNSNLSNLESDLVTLKNYFDSKGITFGVIFWGGDTTNDTTYYTKAMNIVQKTKHANILPGHSLFMSFTQPNTVPKNLTECASNSHTRLLNDGWSYLNNSPKNSTFNCQTNVPSTMVKNTNRTVTVTFTNTGKTTWQAPSNDGSYWFLDYTPKTVSPPCGVASNSWNQIGGVLIPAGTCVSPGKSITLSFTIKAPPSTGTYQFRWRMTKEDQNGLVTKFGQFTSNTTAPNYCNPNGVITCINVTN